MHIRNLRGIRPKIDLKTASTVTTSIGNAKLDYCNSLLLNIDITQTNRLQAIQNAIARAVINLQATKLFIVTSAAKGCVVTTPNLDFVLGSSYCIV